MANSSDFSSILTEFCSRAKLTQNKLALKLDVALPSVNRWINNKAMPSPRIIRSIREFVVSLGTTYGDLVEKLDALIPSPEVTLVESAPVRRRGRPKAQDGEVVVKSEKKDDSPVKLDVKGMEGLLWRAACAIRGEKDAPKFKDYLLPLVFIKRLSDVFEDEMERLAVEYGDRVTAETIVEQDFKDEEDPKKRIVRFYLPPEARWPVVSGRQVFNWADGKRPKTLGEQLTLTVRTITKDNPTLAGVIDLVDFNETRNGEREISDEALRRVVEILSDPRYRLGLNNVEPDFLGRAYEYLLRKFAEGQGQSAGEFFTPMEVGWLLAYLVEPDQGEEVHDPCSGSGGLLIKCQLALRERLAKSGKKIDRPLKLYGQELTGSSFAIARMNMVLHDMDGEIVRGNSMQNPKFIEKSRLKTFDIVVTNPMWNQKGFSNAVTDANTQKTKEVSYFEQDPFDRFTGRGGYAPSSSADWAWIQHVHACLSDRGRAAIVIDTGAASRGSGNDGENKEKMIRKWFVDNDLIETVILLPDNLFYNTTAAGMVMIVNRAKVAARRGKILLVNAGAEFEKGRPKNYLSGAAIAKIAAAVKKGIDQDQLVKVVTTAEVVANDYNLSPSRYVAAAAAAQGRDIQTILDELYHPEKGLSVREKQLDAALAATFKKLGFKL